jgi:tetratricopeptide (TPR) repeat protein
MTDIRVQLENELDTLQEENVESWIQRCFESCDPRYDSDWLSGMLELAHMQFPDHYEVRAACSRAIVLEARRLAGEGDKKEAMRRLEQLLEADPYCTEGFEFLEELSKPPSAEVPPVEAPALAPESVPAVLPEILNSSDEELVATPPAVPEPAAAPAPPEASAPSPATHNPEPAVNAPALPWDELWKLPRPLPEGTPDTQYLQVVLSLAEKMRALGRPDAALRILVDHRQDLDKTDSWSDHIKSTLLAWVNKLASSQHGAQAAQVCDWGSRIVPASPEIQELAADLTKRFGLPKAPASANDEWRSRLEATPADAALLDEIQRAHQSDVDGLLMLFRQVAVENPEDSRHILNLGWAYLKAGTAVLALVHTQRALKLSPTRRAYQILADTYEKLGQRQLQEAALRSLQETAAP